MKFHPEDLSPRCFSISTNCLRKLFIIIIEICNKGRSKNRLKAINVIEAKQLFDKNASFNEWNFQRKIISSLQACFKNEYYEFSKNYWENPEQEKSNNFWKYEGFYR